MVVSFSLAVIHNGDEEMKMRDFVDLSEKCYGLVPAVADASGCNVVSSELIKNISVVGFELIGYRLLATMPVLEWCANRYEELGIYAIWSDGKMDKVFPTEFEQLVISHSQRQGMEMRPFVAEMKPLAAYFVDINKYNANRVICIRKFSQDITVIVYESSQNCDVEQAIFEVMAVSQSEGETGLENLVSRFNSGVGLGQHQIKVPAPPIFQVA